MAADNQKWCICHMLAVLLLLRALFTCPSTAVTLVKLDHSNDKGKGCHTSTEA